MRGGDHTGTICSVTMVGVANPLTPHLRSSLKLLLSSPLRRCTLQASSEEVVELVGFLSDPRPDVRVDPHPNAVICARNPAAAVSGWVLSSPLQPRSSSRSTHVGVLFVEPGGLFQPLRVVWVAGEGHVEVTCCSHIANPTAPLACSSRRCLHS